MASEPEVAISGDIGGTHMRAALITRSGEILDRGSIDTQPDDGIEIAANRLADLVESLDMPVGVTPAGFGISTAGPIDPETGVYKNPPNLGAWDERSMKPILSERLSTPIHVGHDATLAAFAETSFGPHEGARNLLYVTISTGVGGGIIANGEMVTGSEGHAGEVGHVTVIPGAQRCNVGCDGCFEGNASGPAIARLALARIDSGEESAIWEAANHDRSQVSPELVFEMADRGDAMAIAVREHVILAIGVGLGSLLNVFDPEALVVGGGVTMGLRTRWNDVVQAVKEHSLAHFKDDPRLHITTLGDDVSLLGAAGLAFRRAG